MGDDLPTAGLPMQEILQQGLRDLGAGELDTEPALWLRIAAPRLASAGISALQPYADEPGESDLELKLFGKLRQRYRTRSEAFVHYKSLQVELNSLANAADARAARVREKQQLG